jgi:hypothetical protein
VRVKSDILVAAGIFAKSLDIRDVEVGVDKLLDKRHDSEGRPLGKSEADDKRSCVHRVHKVGDDADFLVGPRTDVCSHVKLEDLSVLQERKGDRFILESERGRPHYWPCIPVQQLGSQEDPLPLQSTWPER